MTTLDFLMARKSFAYSLQKSKAQPLIVFEENLRKNYEKRYSIEMTSENETQYLVFQHIAKHNIGFRGKINSINEVSIEGYVGTSKYNLIIHYGMPLLFAPLLTFFTDSFSIIDGLGFLSFFMFFFILVLNSFTHYFYSQITNMLIFSILKTSHIN